MMGSWAAALHAGGAGNAHTDACTCTLSKAHCCIAVVLTQAPHLRQPTQPLTSLTRQLWQQQHMPALERGSSGQQAPSGQ